MGHIQSAERFAASGVASVLSFGLTIGIVIASIAYPRETRGVIQAAEIAWKDHVFLWLESALQGSGWGQVAINVIRERVNGTYLLIYLVCAIFANAAIGFLWGSQSPLNRITLAFFASWVSVLLALLLLVVNLHFPQEYGFILKMAEELWRDFLRLTEQTAPDSHAVQAFVNVARTGINGHHYVILAVAGFLTNFLLRSIVDKVFR